MIWTTKKANDKFDWGKFGDPFLRKAGWLQLQQKEDDLLMLMLGKFITQFYQMCQTWMKITKNIQIDENLQVLGVFFGYNERCVFGYNENVAFETILKPPPIVMSTGIPTRCVCVWCTGTFQSESSEWRCVEFRSQSRKLFLFEQWKKPWLVGLYRGLYYPVI